MNPKGWRLPMIDILIVDDNAQIREALRMELQAQGKVRIVGEVSEGIAELLRGLESTARIVATLGLPDNAPEIERRGCPHRVFFSGATHNDSRQCSRYCRAGG